MEVGEIGAQKWYNLTPEVTGMTPLTVTSGTIRDRSPGRASARVVVSAVYYLVNAAAVAWSLGRACACGHHPANSRRRPRMCLTNTQGMGEARIRAACRVAPWLALVALLSLLCFAHGQGQIPSHHSTSAPPAPPTAQPTASQDACCTDTAQMVASRVPAPSLYVLWPRPLPNTAGRSRPPPRAPRPPRVRHAPKRARARPSRLRPRHGRQGLPPLQEWPVQPRRDL